MTSTERPTPRSARRLWPKSLAMMLAIALSAWKACRCLGNGRPQRILTKRTAGRSLRSGLATPSTTCWTLRRKSQPKSARPVVSPSPSPKSPACKRCKMMMPPRPTLIDYARIAGSQSRNSSGYALGRRRPSALSAVPLRLSYAKCGRLHLKTT